MRWLGAILAVLLSASLACAQTPFIPTQAFNSKNQEVTSGTGAAVSVTLTAATHTRAHLYQIQARCSAATAGITITDGGTQIWSTAATAIGTSTFNQPFTPGMVGGLGNNMVITLTACAGGVGTLDVQADVF